MGQFLETLFNSNFPIILATLLSPVLAVWVTILYQKRDLNHRLRLNVFTDLMKHRRRFVSPDFVNALNLVPIVFHDNTRINQALKDVLDVVGSNDWTIPPEDARFQDVRNRLN